jgi:predicted ATPase
MRKPSRRGTIAPFTMSVAHEAAMICPTTFGREVELATLSQLVERLLEGRGMTVLLSGEAGIGKSRLVAEARAKGCASGVRVVQGSAFELDQTLPYGPIADLLRVLLGSKSPQEVVALLGPAVVAVGRLLPGVGAWLPPDFSDGSARAPSDPELNRQQLLQGLLLAFDRAVQQGPTIIVVEDVHWADEASLDLLLHLARSAADRSLLLVLTLRNEDAGPAALDFRVALERQRLMLELQLSPLDRRQTEAMVCCLAGSTPQAEVLQTIVGLAEVIRFL